MENSFHFFPLWKRGMKGDLTAFQKAKRLQNFEMNIPEQGLLSPDQSPSGIPAILSILVFSEFF